MTHTNNNCTQQQPSTTLYQGAITLQDRDVSFVLDNYDVSFTVPLACDPMNLIVTAVDMNNGGTEITIFEPCVSPVHCL